MIARPAIQGWSKVEIKIERSSFKREWECGKTLGK